MSRKNLKKRIVINSRILKGKPIIKGTRISVEFVLELLSSGMTQEEILDEYPHLKKEDILACIAWASDSVRKEEIISTADLEAYA